MRKWSRLLLTDELCRSEQKRREKEKKLAEAKAEKDKVRCRFGS